MSIFSKLFGKKEQPKPVEPVKVVSAEKPVAKKAPAKTPAKAPVKKSAPQNTPKKK